MTDLKYTDDEIIKALSDKARATCEGCELIKKTVGCENCVFEATNRLIEIIRKQKAETEYWRTQYMIKCGDTPASVLVAQAEFEAARARQAQALRDEIARLECELFEARRDRRETERNHKNTVITNFKTALLKRIFPFGGVDRKQYSINAYAVEKAIEEVAKQMTRG